MNDPICECPKCGRQHRDLGFGRPPAAIAGEQDEGLKRRELADTQATFADLRAKLATDALTTTPYVSAPARSREQAALDIAETALKDILRATRAISIRAENALADIETLRQSSAA